MVGDAEGHWEQLLRGMPRPGNCSASYNDNQVDLSDYRTSLFEGKRYAPVELVRWGRGCRFACDFCSIHSFYGKNLRQRLVEGLVAEMASFKRNRLVFLWTTTCLPTSVRCAACCRPSSRWA